MLIETRAGRGGRSSGCGRPHREMNSSAACASGSASLKDLVSSAFRSSHRRRKREQPKSPSSDIRNNSETNSTTVGFIRDDVEIPVCRSNQINFEFS
jgi:hypothetical protein